MYKFVDIQILSFPDLSQMQERETKKFEKLMLWASHNLGK